MGLGRGADRARRAARRRRAFRSRTLAPVTTSPCASTTSPASRSSTCVFGLAVHTQRRASRSPGPTRATPACVAERLDGNRLRRLPRAAPPARARRLRRHRGGLRLHGCTPYDHVQHALRFEVEAGDPVRGDRRRVARWRVGGRVAPRDRSPKVGGLTATDHVTPHRRRHRRGAGVRRWRVRRSEPCTWLGRWRPRTRRRPRHDEPQCISRRSRPPRASRRTGTSSTASRRAPTSSSCRAMRCAARPVCATSTRRWSSTSTTRSTSRASSRRATSTAATRRRDDRHVDRRRERADPPGRLLPLRQRASARLLARPPRGGRAGSTSARTTADPELSSLITVVPFGVEDEPPRHLAPAMRGCRARHRRRRRDRVSGAAASTTGSTRSPLIRAVDRLRHRRPRVRLFFAGVRHPNAERGRDRDGTRARARSPTSSASPVAHVFFHDWIAYDERAELPGRSRHRSSARTSTTSRPRSRSAPACSTTCGPACRRSTTAGRRARRGDRPGRARDRGAGRGCRRAATPRSTTMLADSESARRHGRARAWPGADPVVGGAGTADDFCADPAAAPTSSTRTPPRPIARGGDLMPRELVARPRGAIDALGARAARRGSGQERCRRRWQASRAGRTR